MRSDAQRRNLGAVMSAVAAAAALAFGPAPQYAHSAQALAFTPADCTALIAPLVDTPLNALLPPPDERMRCGYVTVPETHGASDGRTLELAVVVLGATGEPPHAAPLFVMQGGPGGGSIDTYQSILRNDELRTSRDIVLFDQRGTGKSQPSLRCSETYDLAVRTAELRMTYTETSRASEEALVACRDRLISSGVDLAAFDSIENARDIDDVRRALGYDKIDLYGVSYGSELAQHAMREIPAALRTVVLDAVAPVNGSFLTDAAHSEDRALTAFFSACAADATCAADYPNLETTYLDLVAELDRRPLHIRVDDPNTGSTYSVPLDGASLQEIFFQLLYSKEMLPLLPKLVDDLKRGDVGLAGNLTSLFAFDRSVAQGMYFSVICADDAVPAETPDMSDLRPQIAERAAQDFTSLRRICRTWAVDPLPAAANEPVRSAIPTLLLNGAFDPITPPQNGVAVAAALENAYVFTFTNTAHGAFPTDPCATNIVRRFLAQPDDRPDHDCIRAAAPLTFVGRDALIPAPVVGQLLTAPSNARQQEFLVLAAATLTLLSSLILLPLGWFIRLIVRGGRRSAPAPFVARVLPWATALHGALTVVFVVGLLGAGIAAAAAGNDYSFLAGVRREWALLFTLPPALVFLTIVMAAGFVAGRRSAAWGVVRTLYRGLLVVAAAGVCVVLALWKTVLPTLLR